MGKRTTEGATSHPLSRHYDGDSLELSPESTGTLATECPHSHTSTKKKGKGKRGVGPGKGYTSELPGHCFVGVGRTTPPKTRINS